MRTVPTAKKARESAAPAAEPDPYFPSPQVLRLATRMDEAAAAMVTAFLECREGYLSGEGVRQRVEEHRKAVDEFHRMLQAELSQRRS